MHSREELVAKIKEAAGHPLALLFGTLGVAYPTPSKTARAAKEKAGLSNEEEKLAKWVAVLKRESQEVFGQDFWQALKTILQEGEKEMEVKWGDGHYRKKGNAFVERIMSKALRGENLKVCVTDAWARYEEPSQHVSGGIGRTPIYLHAVPCAGGNSYYSAQLGGFRQMGIAVYYKGFLSLAKRLARECEKRTGHEVTIIKEYGY